MYALTKYQTNDAGLQPVSFCFLMREIFCKGPAT